MLTAMRNPMGGVSVRSVGTGFLALVGLGSAMAWMTLGPGTDAVDMITYSASYAAGHVQSGLWTEARRREHVVGAVLAWVPTLVPPLLLLTATGVALVHLRRQARTT
jgi:hypothetical protein